MGVSKEVDAMDRRKKGSGQITHVPGRKSPWRASVVDNTGKQKSRFFKTEKEAKEKAVAAKQKQKKNCRICSSM